MSRLLAQDGHAAFGTLTDGDAKILARMGADYNVPGNNVPGHIFTLDGQAPHFPSASDNSPTSKRMSSLFKESMGAYNAMQQSDVHSYWEFNYLGTNWIHPLYELPFTGGFPDNFGQAPDAFAGRRDRQAAIDRPRPGTERGNRTNRKRSATTPISLAIPTSLTRDDDAQREFRQRGVPSGLANEIYLDVYERLASFEPHVRNLQQTAVRCLRRRGRHGRRNGTTVSSPRRQGDIDTP